MSAAFVTYALVACSVNGTNSLEEIKLSIKRESGIQLIKTVLGGFRGGSPGAQMMVGSVNSALPGTGIEFPNMGQYIYAGSTVMLGFTIVQSGLGLIGPALILDDEIAHGAGVPAGYDFAFAMGWQDFQ